MWEVGPDGGCGEPADTPACEAGAAGPAPASHPKIAGIAQMAVQRSCKPKAVGSSPTAGTSLNGCAAHPLLAAFGDERWIAQ
jgi:hypothetical protein